MHFVELASAAALFIPVSGLALDRCQSAAGPISAVQQRLNQRPVSGSVEAALNVAYWVFAVAERRAAVQQSAGHSNTGRPYELRQSCFFIFARAFR
jgi:hypothetical protein